MYFLKAILSKTQDLPWASCTEITPGDTQGACICVGKEPGSEHAKKNLTILQSLWHPIAFSINFYIKSRISCIWLMTCSQTKETLLLGIIL